MREQENFLYAESQQVNALAQILLLDSRAMDKTEQHIHGKEGSGSTSQFTRWCSLYEKKSSRSSFCRRSRSKLSARIHECMKNELVTLMMLQDMKCERCCRGLQRSILQVTAATNIQKRKDVHQYLLQKALAQSHTGETALVIFPWKYVQDALTLCTRTSLLAAQESDFFLYLNPDPLRNLQHSYKQINKKPKLRRNSEYTKQS